MERAERDSPGCYYQHSSPYLNQLLAVVEMFMTCDQVSAAGRVASKRSHSF
jgi:hypothetical protein